MLEVRTVGMPLKSSGKHMMRLILPFIALFLIILVVVSVNNSDKVEIERWAADEGYTIVSCEQTIFDTGPFYYKSKHHRVYRVVVATPEERTTYFRFGSFGYDREWAN